MKTLLFFIFYLFLLSSSQSAPSFKTTFPSPDFLPESPFAEPSPDSTPYYNALLSSFRESCTKKYETLLAELKRLQNTGADKQQIAGKQVEIADLYQKATNYEYYGGAVQRIAEEYSRIKPDSTESLSGQIFDLIKNGRIAEARSLLKNTGKSESLTEQAKQIQINRFLLDADLAQLQLKWDEAERDYEQALALDSLHIEANEGFATFLLGQGQSARSLTYFNTLSQLPLTDREKAVCLSNMSGVYFNLNDLPAAEKALEESLAASKRLAQNDTGGNSLPTIRALRNLAIVYATQNDIPSAEEALAEALKLSRKLAKDDSERFKFLLAEVLEHLSHLELLKQNFDSAFKSQDEALVIFKKLSKSNPLAFEPHVAMAHTKLAAVHRWNQDIDGAEENFSHASTMFKRLAQSNPLVFEREVAARLRDLSFIYYEKEKLSAEEEKTLAEALALNKQMAEIEPTTFEPDAAFLFMVTGFNYTKSKRTEQAKAAFEKSLSLAQKYPESPIAIQVKAHVELTFTEQAAAPLEQQLETLEGATALAAGHKKIALAWEEGLKKYPDNSSILEQAAWAYGNLAWYFLLAENFPEAEKSARKSIELDKNKEPHLQAYLAHALLFQGKYSEAAAIYAAIKNETDEEERPYGLICAAELNDFEASGITHPDAARAIELLEK
jgi:tetratricopeptide (TPR) repeat protein